MPYDLRPSCSNTFVLCPSSTVFSIVFTPAFRGCMLATFLAAARCFMNIPNSVKKMQSNARQKNTMPMASTVMPIPYGSLRFNLAIFVSSTCI